MSRCQAKLDAALEYTVPASSYLSTFQDQVNQLLIDSCNGLVASLVPEQACIMPGVGFFRLDTTPDRTGYVSNLTLVLESFDGCTVYKNVDALDCSGGQDLVLLDSSLSPPGGTRETLKWSNVYVRSERSMLKWYEHMFYKCTRHLLWELQLAPTEEVRALERADDLRKLSSCLRSDGS